MKQMSFDDVKVKVESENPSILLDPEFIRDFLTYRIELTDSSNNEEYNLLILDYAERNFHTDWPTILTESLSLNEEDSELFMEFYANHPNIVQGMSDDAKQLIISPSSQANSAGQAGITSPTLFFAELKQLKKRGK